MQKSKPPFHPEYDGPDAPALPAEEDYLARPSATRRKLTPRDLARNQGAHALFQRATPGLPIDADPPETRQPAEPFAAVIDRLLTRLDINAAPPWLEELAAAWPRLVPPDVAAHARPGKWESNILFIYVANSRHLFEIRRRHLRALEQTIRDFLPDIPIRHIRLMIDSVPLP